MPVTKRKSKKKVTKKTMKCNSPKRTPNHKTKSHIVLAAKGHTMKLIRFGQQGKTGDRTMTKRAKSFKARHAKNIKKGIMSAAYWANKVKW